MPKKIFIALFFLLAVVAVQAQELQGRVTVLAQQISTTVDKKVFNTLQTQLNNLINTRKWTSDVFQPQEKIQCNFLLNILSAEEDNVYKATLTIQATRPVYKASYQTGLINFQDGDVTFKYVEYQPIEFNETRVGGSDPLQANITAVFAYYVYMILGLDYDSFSPKGGDEFFKKAQNIVNNAPESKQISGWKAFDGLRNRYWLADNIMDTKYNLVHDIIYNYYRQGLDNLYEDEESGRSNLLDALASLQDFNQQNPNTMIAQFLVQGKSTEYIGIFKKSNPVIKSQAREILTKIDISNAPVYNAELR